MGNYLRSRSGSCLFFILLFLFFFCLAKPVLAKSGYISDRLIVYIKDSIEAPNKNIGRVQTGDKVDIIETKDNYHLIKTDDNQEGWILKQYILFSEPKEMVIKTIQAENSALREQLAEQEETNAKKLEDVRHSFKKAGDQDVLVKKAEELKELSSKGDRLLARNKALEISIQAKERENSTLENKRKKLAEKINQLDANLAKIRKAGLTSILGLDPRITWLLTGAFILLVGMLIGKSGKRKQPSKLSF